MTESITHFYKMADAILSYFLLYATIFTTHGRGM